MSQIICISHDMNKYFVSPCPNAKKVYIARITSLIPFHTQPQSPPAPLPPAPL